MSVNPIITFVANDETKGDAINPQTMDYFLGKQSPWLSLAIPRLHAAGYKTEVVSWQDPAISWREKPCLILGPVWGYSKQLAAFNRWLAKLSGRNNTLQNSAKFIQWNVQKTYLMDLLAANIPIPHTMIVAAESELTLSEVMQLAKTNWHTNDIIIKGVVDAAAFGFMHIKRDGDFSSYRTHYSLLKEKNNGVVVQPFLPSIQAKGEFSFVFFADTLSHYYLKVATKGEARVQVFYGGKSFHINETNFSASLAAIKVFRKDICLTEQEVLNTKNAAVSIHKKIIALLASKQIEAPIYMRIDGMFIDQQFLVMEIEGIEPYMEMKEAMQANPSNDVVGHYVKTIIAAVAK